MATKADGCPSYDKAAQDEPIFVLRAQDRLSYLIVRYWIMLAEEAGVNDKKLEEARRCEAAMREWSNQKTPD